MRPAVQEQMRRVSAMGTKVLTRRYGESLGIWYGCGFPKSGTVWLCELMSSYLYLPYPQNYLTPVLMKSVVHSHWEHDPRRTRCIYIVRDGRDVMVSYFHHWMNQLNSGRSPRYTERRRAAIERIAPGVPLTETRELLPSFISAEFADPRGSKLTWNDHVADWIDSGVPVVRYEQLLDDGPRLLADAFGSHGIEVDMQRMHAVFDLHRFELRTGRARGDEDPNDFRRSGTAGGWRDVFSPRAAEVFAELAQDGLERCGYERDESWVRTLEDRVDP